MSLEKKLSLVVNILDLLRIPSYKRTQENLETIFKYASNFKFFQELSEREDSLKLQYDCCRVLTVSTYLADEFICKKGDEADSFYLIIKGRVVIISEETPVYPDSNNFIQTGQDELVSESRALTPRSNYSQQKPTEVAILTSGQSFGEMALINNGPRYFSVKTLEPCILAVLNKDDYHTIARVHEKQIIEKIEFIRNMEAFKNWTKIAVQKLSYFFKTQNYRKGNIVYKETDPATDIYIIKEGEFLFTQKFKVEAGEKNEGEIFGQLTKKVPKKVFRKKVLKIVVKQKGEIFGYDEIMQELDTRQFTCTCLSNTGELLVISDKNLAKKIVRPETLKYIEDSYTGLKHWVNNRVDTLRQTEVVKDSIIYTPFNKIKVPRPQAATPDLKLPVLYSPSPLIETKPTVIDKFLRHSRQKSLNVKNSNTYGVMFKTEIRPRADSGRHRHNSSFGNYNENSFVY